MKNQGWQEQAFDLTEWLPWGIVSIIIEERQDAVPCLYLNTTWAAGEICHG